MKVRDLMEYCTGEVRLTYFGLLSRDSFLYEGVTQDIPECFFDCYIVVFFAVDDLLIVRILKQ